MLDHEETIEVRAVNSSSHSSEDEIGDTYSVDSTITQYRMENGRRYHAYKDGTYWAPNDERQNENLDISHHKFLLLLDGKLHLAPLEKNIERVLDIGTGTGIWAIDFADEHPDTIIHGTDLSPIQPDLVPPNCKFEIDDARDEWTYPPEYFDFIHVRGLFGSIKDWPALYKQILKHLKPGGYLEQVEISIEIKSDDGTVTSESPLVTFTDLFTEAGHKTGQSFRVSDFMRQDIEAAGFVNVVERVYKTPIGGWAADPRLRELGQWALLGLDTGLEGYALATLTRVMGWSPSEVHVLMARVRAELRDRRIHTLHDIKVVYAQKPPVTSSASASTSTSTSPNATSSVRE